jgi:hypothetical protein
MPVAHETRSPIASSSPPRNGAPPVLAPQRPRPAGRGVLLLAVVWAAALAFFVLGVAAPAAMLHGHGGRTEVAAAAP